MKTVTIYRFLLVLLAVATPGFIQFDRTGLSHEYGLLNPQSIWRIAIYMAVGVAFLLTILAGRRRLIINHENKGGSLVFGMKLLLCMYALYLFTSFFHPSVGNLLLSSYRVFEWILIILLCCYAFPIPSNNGVTHDERIFSVLNIVKIIVNIVVITVLVGVLFFPEIAYSHSIETGTYRLGGYMYHPNKLGVLCGVGSILFWYCSKTSAGKVWAIILFILMLLTYSRGAIIGFFIAVFFANISTKNILRTSSLFFLTCSAILLIYSYDSAGVYGEIVTILKRGSNLEQLISFNSRTFVWSAALSMISDSPLTGHGFIFGPKRIGEFVGQPWWIAPHAHNDILNAAVAGGAVMGGLTIAVYFRLIKSVVRHEFPDDIRVPIAAIILQFGVISVLTPILSTSVSILGIVLVLILRLVTLSSIKVVKISNETDKFMRTRPALSQHLKRDLEAGRH